MKLWLIQPVAPNEGPWNPWYDKAFGFVVRAQDEESARKLADSDAGDENRYGVKPWLEARYSTCVELSSEGEVGIVMKDFHAA